MEVICIGTRLLYKSMATWRSRAGVIIRVCKAYRRIVIDSTSRPMLEAPGELSNEPVACDEPLSISERTFDAPEPESSTEFSADTGGGGVDVATGGVSHSGDVPAACRGGS